MPAEAETERSNDQHSYFAICPILSYTVSQGLNPKIIETAERKSLWLFKAWIQLQKSIYDKAFFYYQKASFLCSLWIPGAIHLHL